MSLAMWGDSMAIIGFGSLLVKKTYFVNSLVCRRDEIVGHVEGEYRRLQGGLRKKRLDLLWMLNRNTIRQQRQKLQPRLEIDPYPHLSIANTVSRAPHKVIANTTRPLPIETDCFKGHVNLLLNEGESAAEKAFEVQVQGRFKREPEGVLYIGAEVKTPFSSHPVARFIARALCRVVHDLAPYLHISLGDSNSASKDPQDVEYAHMMYPLWKAADTFHATPMSVVPPALGKTILEETKEDYNHRVGPATLDAMEFSCEHTYTFAFFSPYIDFVNWKVIGLSVARDFGLEKLWGDNPIHVCMYEVPREDADGKHIQSKKNYIIGFDVTNELAKKR